MRLLLLALLLLLNGIVGAQPADPPASTGAKGKQLVYVVPIKDAIYTPTFYIVRRALKEAIREDAAVLIEMDTPGGELGAMLEIMEALDRYEGDTTVFIDDEAISAGAFIALAADRIYFDPKGIIGAAEPVTATGEDVNEGMKRKIESYLRAKITALTRDHPRRADILRAMFEPDFVLEIDGQVLSQEGDLLSLTADQAVREYGNPPTPLLADGIAYEIDDVLNEIYGIGNYERVDFETSWSEVAALYLKSVSPILISLGILLLFAEFKTPGFGVFGLLGIASLSLVFLANSVAGLAGYEVILLLMIGLAFIAADIFLFPGTFVLGGTGVVLVLGTFLWSLADVWPAQESGEGMVVVWSSVVDGAATLSIALLLGIAGFVGLLYVIPRVRYFDRFTVNSVSGGTTEAVASAIGGEAASLVGKTGVVTRDLRPHGEIEIEGERHSARVVHGSLHQGRPVRVLAQEAFNLLVEEVR